MTSNRFSARIPRRMRFQFLGSLVLVLSLILGACAVPPPPPAAAPEQPDTEAPATTEDGEDVVTLRWAMWGSPAEVETHQMVADAFMDEHPNINIEIVADPWNDYFTKYQTVFAAGDPAQIPDVLFIVPTWTPRFAADGALENLEPWIERDGYDLDDYWPDLMESARYEGEVYGLPRDISIEVLYYNKDIFDEVGVEYPNENWTWDDFLAAAEELTIVEDTGRVERYALGMEGGKYQLWMGQNGAQIIDDVHNPSECLMDTPEAIEAIEFFAYMMNNNLAMRSASLNQAGGDAAVFANGQVAMIIQNASRVSAFNEAGLNYDVSVVPIPEGGQRSGTAVGAAWFMTSASQHKDEAWTFLSWLQSTEGGQELYTASGEIFPALQSTARGEAFLAAGVPPENREAFLVEAENATMGRAGYFAEWPELAGTIINPTLEEIWAGDSEPADVLPQMCDQMNQWLEENDFPR
jgi:multiple sugar transport system substrate-binding protein